jgi:hypothetical protein
MTLAKVVINRQSFIDNFLARLQIDDADLLDENRNFIYDIPAMQSPGSYSTSKA